MGVYDVGSEPLALVADATSAAELPGRSIICVQCTSDSFVECTTASSDTVGTDRVVERTDRLDRVDRVERAEEGIG